MKASVWDNKIRPKCKRKFAAAGVTYCQMCGRHDYLSFAHRMKRRFITDEPELLIVALLCMDNPEAKGCHNRLEHGPKEVMYDTVTRLYEQINGRIICTIRAARKESGRMARAGKPQNCKTGENQ